MSIKKILAIGVVIFLTASPLMADIIAPTNYCSKPYNPYEFNSQLEVDNFNYDVQQYKQCIFDFVDEQNEAVEVHQKAARDAIEEWNSFVNYELN